MNWTYNDGGRKAAGYKGEANDCVTRAIAIAAELPYQMVYDLVDEMGLREHAKGLRGRRSTARTGAFKYAQKHVLESLGWHWTATMGIGTGCKVHLKASELPSGRVIVSLSRHMAAVIDGVIHDTHDCSRDETRCVYGYWTK
jgi:hypothetical protein